MKLTLEQLTEIVPDPVLGMKLGGQPRWEQIAWDIMGPLEDSGEIFGGSSGEAVQDTMWIIASIFLEGLDGFASYRALYPAKGDNDE